MSQTKVAEKIKTYILYSATFSEIVRTVYEIMWQNAVQREWLHTTKWQMRIACWIPKATNTHNQAL
jgi:hypothetical protein